MSKTVQHVSPKGREPDRTDGHPWNRCCARDSRAKRRPSPPKDCAQGGFSLVEVLVSMAIIAIALLGAGGLQLRAMQLGQGSQFRTQAILLADDLAERMEANKTAATASGLYTVTETSTAPTTAPACTTACSPPDMAALDLYQWQTRIPTLLPQSAWSVRQTVNGNPSTYEITVKWADSRGDKSYGTSASDVIFSYVATRTIFKP
jgi:type IV pilus assembly protein PilV